MVVNSCGREESDNEDPSGRDEVSIVGARKFRTDLNRSINRRQLPLATASSLRNSIHLNALQSLRSISEEDVVVSHRSYMTRFNQIFGHRSCNLRPPYFRLRD